MQTGYIKSLDGVRAVAILLVMAFHLQLLHFGWMGVQLFFVLSGFLITGILLKEKDRPQSNGAKLQRFWIRRSLRIFPLYFAYLGLWLLTYLLFRFPVYFPEYAPYLFTYTFNYTRTLETWQGNPLFTHLWSLCIEEQFYLFFPLLVFLLPRKWLPILLAAALLLAPATRYWLGEHYFQKGLQPEVVADAVYWHTLSHLDAFFAGGILHFVRLRQLRWLKALLLLAGLVALVAGFFNWQAHAVLPFWADLGYSHGQAVQAQYVWQYSVLNVFFALLLLYLTRHKASRLNKFFETGWMVKIGQVSYGMYLFHWAVLVYGWQRLLPLENTGVKLLLFVPYVASVYLVSRLSFHLFEQRFLALKEKFSGSAGDKTPLASAQSGTLSR